MAGAPIIVALAAAACLLALAYRVITACRHKWAVRNTINVFETEVSIRPYARKIVLQCERCGAIKKRVV